MGGALDGGGGKGGKSSAEAVSAIGAMGTTKATSVLTSNTSTSATAAVGGAEKVGNVITIVVGSTVVNKSLVFTPNNIKAAPGDILQFQFSMLNHTVTQSSFDAPCQPIQQSDATAAGIHSVSWPFYWEGFETDDVVLGICSSIGGRRNGEHFQRACK